jgi:hypothetical protein
MWARCIMPPTMKARHTPAITMKNSHTPREWASPMRSLGTSNSPPGHMMAVGLPRHTSGVVAWKTGGGGEGGGPVQRVRGLHQQGLVRPQEQGVQVRVCMGRVRRLSLWQSHLNGDQDPFTRVSSESPATRLPPTHIAACTCEVGPYQHKTTHASSHSVAHARNGWGGGGKGRGRGLVKDGAPRLLHSSQIVKASTYALGYVSHNVNEGLGDVEAVTRLQEGDLQGPDTTHTHGRAAWWPLNS